MSLPNKIIVTGSGRIQTNAGFIHPIFGLVYVHQSLPVNILSAYAICHNNKYEIHTYPDGTLDVRVNDEAKTMFFVRWKRRTLVIDMNEIIQTAGNEDQMMNIENLSNYDDLEQLEEEIEECNQYFDDDIHLHLLEEESYNRMVELFVRDEIALPATIADYDYLREVPLSKIKIARKVRQVHRTLGFRPASTIASLISKGFLKNVPVDATILRVTDEILGRPVEYIKGTMRRRRTKRFKFYDQLQNKDLALEIDVMYFLLHDFLLGITIPYAHSYASYLGERKSKHKTSEHLMAALRRMVNFYISYGWQIKYVVFDGERAMGTPEFMEMIRQLGARPVSMAHGDHCHRIERRQGVLKSVSRTLRASFPTALPVSLVPHLVQHALFQVNFNETRANRDKRPPILEITGEECIDYGGWFKAAFGDFIQVFQNDMVPDKSRSVTMDAIALYPGESVSEGWFVLSIDTGRILRRSNFVVCEKYSERAIRFLVDLAMHDNKISERVHRHGTDIDRIQESKPRAIGDLIADPLQVEGDDINLGALLVDIQDKFDLAEDSYDNVDTVLAGIWQEAEAEATVFLAQYSLLQGVSMYGEAAIDAVRVELRGILEKAVGEPKKWKDVPKAVRSKIIPTKVIISEKIKNGILEQLKGRIVVLGHLQEHEGERNLRSPTPTITTVMVQAARAAAEGRTVITFDVSQAFLNADIDDDQTYIRLPKRIAEILISIDGKYKEYLCHDGSIVIKLLKALYGLRKAPKLWRDTFRAVLLSEGYNESKADECLYVKFYDNGNSTDTSVHVDDGFLTTSSIEEAERLINRLETIFKLKVNRGNTHDFLGLHFEFNSATGDVMITQPGYIAKIVGDTKYRLADTPHTAELFSVDQDSEILNEEEREKFHTTVARCLYLALRTRPDIIVATNFLTTRVKKGTATRQDKKKLDRLCGYLCNTTNLGIKLGGDICGKIGLFAYADAAYGVHKDAKSHSGMFFSLGRGPIYIRSCKQRCVTRSSCEAELIALSELTSLALWLDHLYEELTGKTSKPITLYEDNTAVIHIVNNGMSTSDRARHIHIRNNFVNQFIKSGDIYVLHCRTELMIADILTKPLAITQFGYLRDYLMGYAIPKKGCVEIERANDK